MQIRVDLREIEMMVGIAISTAPNYTIRNAMTASRAFDRKAAVETLTARVLSALDRYELTREATEAEAAPGMLPLFPELKPEW